jgi:Holliday junction resolvase
MKKIDYREVIRNLNAEKGGKNYQNGMEFEFRVLRKEKRNSLNVIRSAGSHSLIDIVSWKKNGQLWLISCKKNGIWTSAELNALQEFKKHIPSNNIIKLAYYLTPKNWVMRTM